MLKREELYMVKSTLLKKLMIFFGLQLFSTVSLYLPEKIVK